MNKHTPGEWKWTRIGQHAAGSLSLEYDPPQIYSTTGELIAECCYGRDGVSKEECEANARLIAESPAMLETLEFIRNKCKTLQEWMLDPNGPGVTVADIHEIEKVAWTAIRAAK